MDANTKEKAKQGSTPSQTNALLRAAGKTAQNPFTSQSRKETPKPDNQRRGRGKRPKLEVVSDSEKDAGSSENEKLESKSVPAETEKQSHAIDANPFKDINPNDPSLGKMTSGARMMLKQDSDKVFRATFSAKKNFHTQMRFLTSTSGNQTRRHRLCSYAPSSLE